jgi:ABC-type transport system involved in multi-copper enzyme maturation permease subunit
MTLTIARQMFTAEVLKLRRNRSLMAFAFVLSVVVVCVFFGYKEIRHASNAVLFAPAGGLDSFERAVQFLGVLFGALAAILIGAEAGTADISSGVFRDLVATGRSRLALFFVRAPAAYAVALAFTAAAFLLALAATFALAGSQPTPTTTQILQSAGWTALANLALVTLAVGVGSLTGSRTLTLTAVIGWQTVATQLILNVSSLGSVRDGLLNASLSQVYPFRGFADGVTMATAVAVAVLASWWTIPTALGAWRTRTQDA